MAFQILGAPQEIHPAYNPSQFWVLETGITTPIALDPKELLGFK